MRREGKADHKHGRRVDLERDCTRGGSNPGDLHRTIPGNLRCRIDAGSTRKTVPISRAFFTTRIKEQRNGPGALDSLWNRENAARLHTGIK